MATLAALLADVYSLTNRPDLVSESTLAVKQATLKCHQLDYFYRDLVVGSFNFADPSLFVQQFNSSTLTRFRSWRYLQNFDPLIIPGSNVNGKQFDIITPDDVFDQYNTLKQDIAWQIGTTLNLRSSVALATLYYGFFQNPDLTNAANMGWISDNHPYAIITEAARIIFKTIGYDEQASVYEKLVTEQMTMLRMSNVLAVGM